MSGNSQRKNKNNSVLTIEADPKDKQSEQAQLLSYVRGMFENLKEDMQRATDQIATQMGSLTDKIDAMENANTLLENKVNSLDDTVEEVRNSGANLKKGVKVPNKKADKTKPFSPKRVKIDDKTTTSDSKKSAKQSKKKDYDESDDDDDLSDVFVRKIDRKKSHSNIKTKHKKASSDDEPSDSSSSSSSDSDSGSSTATESTEDDSEEEEPFNNRRISALHGRAHPLQARDNVTVMVTPYEVKENEKMNVISPKAFKRIVEIYRTYQATSLDKTKRLIHFISTDVRKELHAEQVLRETVIGLNVKLSHITDLEDKHTERMIADKLRPNDLLSYTRLFSKSLTATSWDKNTTLKFSAANYYDHIFPYITIFLEEIEVYYDLFRRGASKSQLKRHPKIEYGKDKQPGLFRILIEYLEPFQQNFVKVLGGEEELKKIKTMKDFITIFKSANKKLARRSRRVAVKDLDLQEPESYKTTVARAKKSKEEMAEAKKSVFSSKKRTSGYLRMMQNAGGEEPYEEAGNEDTDEEIFNSGKTEEEVEAAWEKKQADKTEAKEKIENWDQTWADYEASNALFVLSPEYRPKPGAGNFKKGLNTKPSQDLICFAHVYEKCDKGEKCDYSHDRMKIEDFLWKQYNRLKYSNFWKDNILQRPPPSVAIEKKDVTPDNRKSLHTPTGKNFATRDGSRTPFKGATTYGQNRILDREEDEKEYEVKGNTSGADDKTLSTEKLGSNRTTPSGVERSDPSA